MLDATIHFDSADPRDHTTTTVINKQPATFDKDGSTGETICAKCGAEIIKSKRINKISTIRLSRASYTYNGKVLRPIVTVKDTEENILKQNRDYTVQYSGEGKSVGRYTVMITFNGNYTGTKTLTYTINPKSTSLKSVSRFSKGFTVKWNKNAKEVTGYQIRYSQKKNMSGAKIVTVKNAKTTSCKIKKLKVNKKYYVQIRTYKTTGGKTYYSSWSSKKML